MLSEGSLDLPPSGAALERRRAIEAVLMIAEEPVGPDLLAQLLEIGVGDVEALCAELGAGYEAESRGFCLVRVAGGYRLQSHPDVAAYIERFVRDGQSARMSAAAMETLAIVAYKQPVSRAQVSAIRGVNVDAVMRTLHQRGYVEEVGRDNGPGQAALYGTTGLFLERLGLDSLADLPPIGEYVPGGDVVEALERGLRPDNLLGDGPDPPAGRAFVDLTAAAPAVDLTDATATAELGGPDDGVRSGDLGRRSGVGGTPAAAGEDGPAEE